MERRVHMALTAALPCRSQRIKVFRSFWKLSGEMPWVDFTWYSQLQRTASCISIAASLPPSHADRIMDWDGTLASSVMHWCTCIHCVYQVGSLSRGQLWWLNASSHGPRWFGNPYWALLGLVGSGRFCWSWLGDLFADSLISSFALGQLPWISCHSSLLASCAARPAGWC